MDIQSVELKEFLMAGQLSTVAIQSGNCQCQTFHFDKFRDHIRSMLLVHRFDIMTWLMSNGVSIPLELLSDDMHVKVGAQSVDY